MFIKKVIRKKRQQRRRFIVSKMIEKSFYHSVFCCLFSGFCNSKENEMKKVLGVFLSVMLVFSFALLSGCAKANPEAEKEAITAATEWLALINDEKYGESWDESSEIFRAAITREKWERTLSGLMKPFGKVVSREKKSARYHTSLPGAPDGEYVVIQFKTSFENKKNAIETITPMKEKDGTWRVSGYYIK